jgi:hypothetical protein
LRGNCFETGPPGIKLLGFKDLDQLAIEDSVKHSMFIYPDESVSSDQSCRRGDRMRLTEITGVRREHADIQRTGSDDGSEAEDGSRVGIVSAEF